MTVLAFLAAGVVPRTRAEAEHTSHRRGLTGAAATTQRTTFKLGYLYSYTASSWAIESLSQCKLAVLHVNADPSMSINLTLTGYDTESLSALALRGAVELLQDPDIVALIGTAYSRTTEAPAAYASLLKKPMISPGSQSVSLVDKVHQHACDARHQPGFAARSM